MLARNVNAPFDPNERKFDVFKQSPNHGPRKLGIVMASTEHIAETRARTLFKRMLLAGEVMFVEERELV